MPRPRRVTIRGHSSWDEAALKTEESIAMSSANPPSNP
jgi:hypothetical protein